MGRTPSRGPRRAGRCRAGRRDQPRIRVPALVAGDDPAQRLLMEQALAQAGIQVVAVADGMDDYLGKPETLAAVEETLGRWIRRGTEGHARPDCVTVAAS